MSVAQSLVGTWKIDNSESENLEAYLQAIGMKDDMIERAIQSEVEVEWKVEGDQITQFIRAPVKSHSVTFTLNSPFDETLQGGKVFETTYTEEDGKLVKRQIGSPYNCTCSTELIGDQLVETRTCESSPPVSSVRKMNRV
ncbi:fatty acid-binding protein 1-like [Watersipora subatra]|uniref:fatty acid-binding protein 1-like n=1 Tax=Watersipora subatra TaxID=2589382 RepID=UPI00355B30C4